MPQSITIAAFIFGAVLLLIALLKGGFKIFGAEISGSAGTAGRVIAAIVGVIFLLVGLGGSMQDPPKEEKAKTAAAESEKALPAPTKPKTKFTEVSALLTAQVSGNWRDNVGVVYQISQAGDHINFVGQFGQGVSQGVGRVRQNQVDVEYQTNLPSRGRGTLVVSADGRQMTGNFYEVDANGRSEQFQRVFSR